MPTSIPFLRDLRRSLLALGTLLLLPLLSWGQTNPTAFDLSTGAFTFTGFASGSTTTYPASMQGHTLGSAEPTSTAASPYLTTASGNQALVASSANVTGANIRNEVGSGVSFSNAGASSIGEITVAVNTTNRTSIQVAWTGRNIANSGRTYGIQLQYRVGTSGSFTYLANNHYVSDGTAADQAFSVTLPAAAENKSVVQVRWLYALVTGNSGSRPRLAIDEVTISSSGPAVAAAPTVTTTTPATGVTATAATIAGNITNLGSPTASTSYGFLYSTSASTAATLVLTGTGVSAVEVGTTGATTGSYSTNLTGLTPSTTYYYRAYATNSTGTGYGDVQSFTTTAPSLTNVTVSSGAPVCATNASDIQVSFTTSGTFSGTYAVQLSDASGSFATCRLQ